MKMHGKVSALVAGSLAALALGLSACGGDEESSGNSAQAGSRSEPVKIRLATTPNLVGWPLYGADKLGFFKEKGLEVENLAVFNSGPPIVEAGLAGDWDIAFLGAPPAINAGNAWNLLTAGIQNEEAANVVLYVRKGEPTDASALKGKEALVVGGSIGEQVLRACMTKLGLGQNDVKLVPLEMPQIYNSFKSGEGAVAQVWSEFVERMDADGNQRLCDGKQAGTQVLTVFAVHPDFAKEQPEAAANAIAAIFKANEMLKSDLDGAISSITDFFAEQGVELTEDDIRRQSARHNWYSLQESTDLIKNGGGAEGLSKTAQFLVDSGQIKALPEMNFLSPQIADAAVGAGQ
jgi:ABC-type nitrate/sulfonate/bicarbonate transport system substrate-binding protein